VRQGFRGKEIQRRRRRIAEQRVEHGQVVTQRLAGGSRRDDDGVLAALSRFDRRRLMRIELVDPLRAQRIEQSSVERWRRRRVAGRARRDALPRGDVAHEGAIGTEIVKDGADGHRD